MGDTEDRKPKGKQPTGVPLSTTTGGGDEKKKTLTRKQAAEPEAAPSPPRKKATPERNAQADLPQYKGDFQQDSEQTLSQEAKAPSQEAKAPSPTVTGSDLLISSPVTTTAKKTKRRNSKRNSRMTYPPQDAPPSTVRQDEAPPGFMTIQVEVPHGLGPERSMLVNTPLGYTAQIIVPYGIPPGAVVPVFIPTTPATIMPPLPALFQPQQRGGYYFPSPHYYYDAKDYQPPPR